MTDEKWTQLGALLRRLEAIVIGLLVTAAIGLFLYGSAMRVLAPARTLDWAEEVTIYLVVWSTLLTGRRLAADRAHISAQVIEHLVSPRVKRALGMAIDALALTSGIQAQCMTHLGQACVNSAIVNANGR